MEYEDEGISMDTIVYDKAKYHSGGDWPPGLPESQSFVHGGLFLGWLVDRCLVSDDLQDCSADDLLAFARREITGPELYANLDGCLDSTMLSRAGNEFASTYFDLSSGAFIEDYEATLASDLPTLYHVADTWENYDKLAVVLDRRFDEWRAAKRAKR